MKYAVLFALLAVPALAACDAADRAFDCQSICERYADCFDADYDVGTCADRCEDNAERDADFDEHADDCESCIDDRSCGESFACADECIGIVP